MSGGDEAADAGPGRGDPEAVRRRDRAKEDGWIRDYLGRAQWGVLATVAGGRPFVNSNLFVYDGEAHAVYLHTARTGRTRENLEGGAPATFTTSAMGRLLPADEALEFSVEYSGVVVFGKGRVVDDPAEAEVALQALLDKYFPDLRPGRDYRAITPGELQRTAVYRLDVEAWSGKEKWVPDDFPGARGGRAVPIPFRDEG